MAVLDGEAPVGVGVVTRRRMTHTLQRLVSCDGSVMPDALTAVARWVREEMGVAVPGDHRTVPLLVEAGWQVIGPRSLLRHRGLTCWTPIVCCHILDCSRATGAQRGTARSMPPPRVAPASPFHEFIGSQPPDVFGHVGELCGES